MPFLAHHDDGAHRLRSGVQAPIDLVGLGKSGELALQFFMRQLRTGKLHAHEKKPGAQIVVLRRFFNVAAALGQKTRNRMDQSDAVRAGQGQNVNRVHEFHQMDGRRLAPNFAQ